MGITSRIRVLGALTLATVVAITLTSCGGGDSSGKDEASKAPDRSAFVPISDEEIGDILGDPSLGWETDPATNKAGAELRLAPAEG